jgi:hypothetical protein
VNVANTNGAKVAWGAEIDSTLLLLLGAADDVGRGKFVDAKQACGDASAEFARIRPEMDQVLHRRQLLPRSPCQTVLREVVASLPDSLERDADRVTGWGTANTPSPSGVVPSNADSENETWLNLSNGLRPLKDELSPGRLGACPQAVAFTEAHRLRRHSRLFCLRVC